MNVWEGKIPNVRWKSYQKKDLIETFPDRYIPIEKNPYGVNHGTSLIPQQTNEWDQLRQNSVTSSILSDVLGFFEPASCSALGLDAKIYSNHDKFVKHILKAKGTTLAKEDHPKFQWGNNHEANAIGTFMREFQSFKYQETGIWELTKKEFEYTPKILSSPDGLILNEKGHMIATAECKAPFPFSESSNGIFKYRAKTPHSTIPVYYVPQILSQMWVTGNTCAYYVSFTLTKGTNVFQVAYDPEYVKLMEAFLSVWNLEYIVNAKDYNPSDPWFAYKEYQKFLDMTLDISKKSVCIKSIPLAWSPSKTDKLFLD